MVYFYKSPNQDSSVFTTICSDLLVQSTHLLCHDILLLRYSEVVSLDKSPNQDSSVSITICNDLLVQSIHLLCHDVSLCSVVNLLHCCTSFTFGVMLLQVSAFDTKSHS